MKNLHLKIKKCEHKICPYNQSRDYNPNNPFAPIRFQRYCEHPNGKFWIFTPANKDFPEKCPI